MRRRVCTCSWCSMPILMVLIRMAIMMPLLKYLLSTIPHSFILVLCHSSLHLILGLHPPCLPAPFWPFLPFSWFPEWTPSLSVSSTAPSSASSFALRTGPTPSASDRAAAHWGQPWVAEAAVRAMGEAWSGLLWWGQGAPEMVPMEDVKGSMCKAFILNILSEYFNAVTYRAFWLLSSDVLPFHWPSSPCLLLLLYLFRRLESPGVSPAGCWKRRWFASWPCGGRGRRAGRVPRSSPRVHWPEWRRTNTALAALAWAGAPSAWSLRIGWRSPRGTGWSWRRNPPGRMRVMFEHTVFNTDMLVIPPRISWKKKKKVFLCYICKYWHEIVWELLANRSYERSVSASSQQDGLRPVELSCCYLKPVSPLGWTSPNITLCTIWLQTKLLCFQWVMSCISCLLF